MQQLEEWPIDRLIDYARNPRKNDHAVDAVAGAIREFGFKVPIVAKSDGTVVDGHLRLKAAKKLKLATVPVLLADDLSDAQVRAFRLSVNKLAELAEWDSEMLANELSDLRADDFDLALLGFDADELAKALQFELSDESTGDGGGEIVEDEIPEPPVDPITKPGDLWILGEHRLLCGDSTKAEDVSRLMNGERAVLMNTDPPYGVSYDNSDRPNPGVAKPRVAKPRVANDGLQDEVLQKFLESCFRVAVDIALEKNAAWYMWHAHLTQGYFAAAAAAAANVILHRQIIWVKPVLLLGRGQYHWKHEPCFMGWVKGSQPPDYGRGAGERNQTTIWELNGVSHADRKEFNHATPKPVELFAIPIVKHTKAGQIVFEPFSGSGPQCIAAERLGRRCFGIEICPRHCDVIVKRWENLTGRKAVLDGQQALQEASC